MSGRVAAPSSPWLVRGRLLDRLAPIGSGGLGMVVAPVGTGKTTLLRQWAQTREHPVLWYAADRVPSVELVRREVARRAGGVVVDDVHLVTDPGGALALRRLVERVARDVPVLLASRALPAFNLARDELPQMVAVTAAELAFLPWEVADLFADVYQDPLDPTAVESVTDRTAGWAAALRLWHLGRRLDQGTGVCPAETGRDSATVDLPECLHEYVDREVLADLPDPLLRFARATSVFDVVTADRADRLLGATSSHRILADLARRVGLVVPQPDGVGYRYHRVLREHLRAGLVADHGLATTRRLFEAAGQVLQAQGAWAEAFRAHCRAGHAEAATELLAAHGTTVLGGSPEICALLAGTFAAGSPSLLLALARALVQDGALVRAGAVAAMALAAGPAVDEVTGCQRILDLAGARHTDRMPPGFPAWPLGAADPDETDRADEASAHARAALHLLASGRVGSARTELALAQALAPPDDQLVLSARAALAAATALVGPHDPAPELAEVYRLARERGLTWVSRLVFAVGVVRGGHPRRWALARTLAQARAHAGDVWGAVLVDSAVAIAQARRGRPDLALADSLAQRYRALGAWPLEAAARSLYALGAAQADVPDAGEAEAAEAFARHVDVPGALAMAYAALAMRRPDRRAELLRLAESTASLGGLGCRPWTWRRDGGPAARERIGGGDAETWAPAPPPIPPVPARRGGAGPGCSVTTAALTVSCLGDFRVRLDGRPVDLSVIRPVAQTVLRILAVHAGSAVHRDVIVATLWGDLREAAALHNLHVAVSSLRRLLGTLAPGRARTLLARNGQAYALAPGGPLLTDLQALDAALAEATRCRLSGDRTGQAEALRAVLDGYVADVLPADGPAEWVLPVRDRYRQSVAAAATTLAELELRRGRPEAAVQAATQGVRVDPWRDAIWRILIAAHVAAGAPAAASRARQEYAAILESLGVASVPPPAPGPRPVPARAARAGGVRTA
ncbi:MAG: BTAD domain-containing putative transcriptional regulator [Dermatophilaceae bacterium]